MNTGEGGNSADRADNYKLIKEMIDAVNSD